MTTAVVLSAGNWPGVEGSILLGCVILLAAVGTGLLFVVSVVAYRQRRSRRYLLVTVAVGALFVRSVVGMGTVSGVVPMTVHHLVEHSFDFSIAALILYAVYQSGPQHSLDE
jgi:cell division protein FtsW (lipid II flippase)